jgi:hypothetical protein
VRGLSGEQCDGGTGCDCQDHSSFLFGRHRVVDLNRQCKIEILVDLYLRRFCGSEAQTYLDTYLTGRCRYNGFNHNPATCACRKDERE